MTLDDLLMDALTYEQEKLAYSIYWLLSKGFANRNQDVSEVNWELVDYQEVQRLMDQNAYDLKIVKLYSVPMGNNLHFIIFAYDEQSAKGHYYVETSRIAQKIFDITHHMDKSFWFPETKEYKSFREMKAELFVFPQTAMIWEKG